MQCKVFDSLPMTLLGAGAYLTLHWGSRRSDISDTRGELLAALLRTIAIQGVPHGLNRNID